MRTPEESSVSRRNLVQFPKARLQIFLSSMVYVLLHWILRPLKESEDEVTVHAHALILAKWRYNSTHSSTRALDWGSGRLRHLTARRGGPQSRTERLEKRQDRHGTYNVILRRVCELLSAWKSSKYYKFVCGCVGVPRSVDVCMRVRECSLAYTAFAIFWSHLWILRLHHIFRYYKRRDFRKKRYWTKMRVLIFSTTFV